MESAVCMQPGLRTLDRWIIGSRKYTFATKETQNHWPSIAKPQSALTLAFKTVCWLDTFFKKDVSCTIRLIYTVVKGIHIDNDDILTFCFCINICIFIYTYRYTLSHLDTTSSHLSPPSYHIHWAQWWHRRGQVPNWYPATWHAMPPSRRRSFWIEVILKFLRKTSAKLFFNSMRLLKTLHSLHEPTLLLFILQAQYWKITKTHMNQW